MLYSQNLLAIFMRMLKVAEFFQCVPFEKETNPSSRSILCVSSGRKLNVFKIGQIWVTLQVIGMIFQLHQNWNFVSTVAKIESVFFIFVINFGVMLQYALYRKRYLFIETVNEMEKFERRYNRKFANI